LLPPRHRIRVQGGAGADRRTSLSYTLRPISASRPSYRTSVRRTIRSTV
jgi:hypothetical protein